MRTTERTGLNFRVRILQILIPHRFYDVYTCEFIYLARYNNEFITKYKSARTRCICFILRAMRCLIFAGYQSNIVNLAEHRVWTPVSVFYLNLLDSEG